MREIFTRLLKGLWVLNIIYIAGYSLLFLLAVIISIFDGMGFYGMGESFAQLIGSSLVITSILVFLQYVLLGNFDPRRLLA